MIGVVLVLLSVYPLAIVGGWWRDQSAMWWYEITSFDSEERIGRAWLFDRLPDELARFFERVNYLDINDPAQLAACRSLRRLRLLYAYHVDITDARIVRLKGLPNLRHLLLLRRTQVTDAGLPELRQTRSNVYHLSRRSNDDGPALAPAFLSSSTIGQSPR